VDASTVLGHKKVLPLISLIKGYVPGKWKKNPKKALWELKKMHNECIHRRANAVDG